MCVYISNHSKKCKWAFPIEDKKKFQHNHQRKSLFNDIKWTYTNSPILISCKVYIVQCSSKWLKMSRMFTLKCCISRRINWMIFTMYFIMCPILCSPSKPNILCVCCYCRWCSVFYFSTYSTLLISSVF